MMRRGYSPMRLPSFSNLIAFDAMARNGTLTRAAEELNVSQPAISRRVAALEIGLGRPLFDRTHQATVAHEERAVNSSTCCAPD